MQSVQWRCLSTTPNNLKKSRGATVVGLRKAGEEEEVGWEEAAAAAAARVKFISSTSNPLVKHCVKLRQSSSYRHSHSSALVVGSTPIREIWELDSLSGLFECLFLVEGAEAPQGIQECIRVSPAVMRKLSGVQSTDSIDAIALVRIPPSFLNLSNRQPEEQADCSAWFPSRRRILVLDGIQDPGNLGTLLRSALAFEWTGVFLLDGCCDPFNDKALRASRGACFRLPVVSANWTHLDALRNKYHLKMLAAHPHCSHPSDPSSSSILSPSLAHSLADTPLCLVLGSEGAGISQKSKDTCHLLSIPMAPHFESLNVAVAGGIFMFMMRAHTQPH